MVIMKKTLFALLALISLSGNVFSDLTWSSPVSISTALVNASDPHTVIDSSGNATAVWVENNTIMSASLPSGGSWGTPVAISTIGNTASNPKLVIDASGNATALWIENTVVTSATLPSGGSWSAETAVSSSGASNAVVTVDSSGNAVAAWVRSGFVESSTRKSGTWSLVSVLSASGSSNPSVTISDSGTAMAAWHSTSSGSDVIVTNSLNVSTNTWASSTKNVFPAVAAFLHNYPKIAIDAFGNATVAWFRYNLVDSNAYENVQVLTASLTFSATNSSNWSLPTILSNPGIRNPADLSIKLRYDTNGDILAVWTNSYDGQTFNMESTDKIFGAASWPLVNTPAFPTIYDFAFDVSTVSGMAVLAYMEWDGTSVLSIQSQQTDMSDPFTQTWTAPNLFSSGSDNGYPSVSVSRSGSTFNAVSVWINFNGTNTAINASTGTDNVVVAPTGVSASQNSTNLGVYTDFYNTITWSASSDPNLSGYNVYRNGVFIGSTNTTTLTFVNHNQIQNGTVTYGVTAFTTAFRQSDLITFTLFP